MDRAALKPGRVLSFGPFRLLPAQHLLLDSGKPVSLGSRALDILIALAERAGELVSNDELIARVWPDTFVEEGNLRVHVAALRRALGDGEGDNRYIVNIRGRGYHFVAPVSFSDENASPHAPSASAERLNNLPAPLTRMLGRDDLVDTLMALTPEVRFITLVGPGGIGKTTVAVALAHKMAPAYKDGVAFVDLGPVTDPHLVPSTLASVLGLAIRSENPLPHLIAFLREKQMLLVLDSCEHVIGSVACLSEEIFKSAAGVHVLATSSELLRAQGERVVRLSPLGCPDGRPNLTAAEALAFPAVQLFVERAAASLDTFHLSDANASFVIDICRRLDGMAFAIEMAAARLDTLTLAEIGGLLDDRFRLLTRGRRTALPRHKTLRATLDWSHSLLPEFQRLILRRLSIFAGWFTANAVRVVLSSERERLAEIVDGIAELVAKSLVVADVAGPVTRYRLFDTTRAYGLEKLAEAGELEVISRSHASYYSELFRKAAAEWELRPTGDWLAEYRNALDNLRAALDWAFSPEGDLAIGVALTVAAAPLWLELSLLEECRVRTEQALAALEDGASQGDRQKMQLHAALAWSQMYRTGSSRRTNSIWATALEIAKALDDTDYQLRALWGLWAGCMNQSRFREALTLAREFCTLSAAAGEEAELLVGDRLIGAALHFLGDQAGSRRHIEHMLDNYRSPSRRAHPVRFQFDQQITARITLARVLWLQGLADQAMRAVETNIAHARSLNHPLSLCNALAQAACPVALMAGDLAAAERFTTSLLDLTARESFEIWHIFGECFQGELLIRRGDAERGLTLLRGGVDNLRAAAFVQHLTTFLSYLGAGFGRVGSAPEGLAAIEEALARCEECEERWCFAELLRIKGELALQENPENPKPAEDEFLRALDWSRRQKALAWELRSAISLARLRKEQNRTRDAHDLLAPVYARFTEGFGTADLKAAEALLTELA
jgi:predicted ATPase/DNA-binding winged helix-turn-helix (wHTH) protein